MLRPYPEGWIVLREHWHFYAAYHRRYGRRLGCGDYSDIRRQIVEGRATLLRQDQVRRTAEYAVRVRRPSKGRAVCFIVWDADRQSIISALPPHAGRRKLRSAGVVA